MFAKESLYINAIKYKSQLKINHKKLKNNDIVETNGSTFIAKDDILSKDIANKLIALSEEIDQSFISTLLLQEDIKILKSNEKINQKDYKVTALNSSLNIAVSKNTLFETKNFFEKCGVDYIFSIYHILNLHIEQTPSKNNLVVMLFNNHAYCLILDDDSQIVFDKTIPLITFEEIKESEFYENDILGQKLFDEMYALDLNQAIKKTIEEFYAVSKKVFIEKVSLLYNFKQLDEKDVKAMADELMIDVSYHSLSIDEALFELSKDTHCKKSYIKPRDKQNSNMKNWIATFVIIILLAAISYIFIPFEDFKSQEEQTNKQEVVKEVKINLPDHKNKNDFIKSKILGVFDLVPYDMVLKEAIFEQQSVRLDVNLLNKDSFIKTVQPELNKLYKNSFIKIDDNKNAILDGIITADTLVSKFIAKTKDFKDTYSTDEFMSIIAITQQLKIILPKEAVLEFKSSFNSDVVTYNYLVNLVVQTPKEFYTFVDSLSSELYSVNISYPVSFVKTEAGIEIEFTLQFHQPKS